MAKKPKAFDVEDIVGTMALPGVEEDSLDPEDIEQVVEARQVPEDIEEIEEPPKEPVKAPKTQVKEAPIEEPSKKETVAEQRFNKALEDVFDAMSAFATAAKAWVREAGQDNDAAKKLEQIKAVLEK